MVLLRNKVSADKYKENCRRSKEKGEYFGFQLDNTQFNDVVAVKYCHSFYFIVNPICFHLISHEYQLHFVRHLSFVLIGYNLYWIFLM